MTRKNAKRAYKPNPREDRKPIEFKIKRNIKLLPRNLNQEDYLEYLDDIDKPIVVAVGPAGTGKTLMATYWAMDQLGTNEFNKIIITRPNIATDDKDIGYLPGTVESKMKPWVLPMVEYFKDYYSYSEIEHMIEQDIIELTPIAYIRGRTFKNSIVIIDEAQNLTRSSMLSILTRIGEGSKMIITGDVQQSDRGTHNGLSEFIGKARDIDGIGLVEFTKNDVERHPIIQQILDKYDD